MNNTTEMLNAYKSINTSTIGHITSEGYLADLRPLVKMTQIVVGRVLTVTLASANTNVIRDALEQAEAGDVLCIDARVLEHRACWGALRTCAAIYEKLTAVVVLGKVTDSLEIEELGLPIYSLGISALTTSNSTDTEGTLRADIEYQVSDYHNTIKTGDFAVLDNDGVFVLSTKQATDILTTCQQKQQEDGFKYQAFLQAYRNNALDQLPITPKKTIN